MISPSNILGDAIDNVKEIILGYRSSDYMRRQDDGTYLVNGFLASVMLDVSFHGYGRDGNKQLYDEAHERRYLHFLMYDSTAVWSLELGVEHSDRRMRHDDRDVTIDQWQFRTCHDSCWRGAARDVLSRSWLEMRERCFAHLPVSLTDEERNYLVVQKCGDNSRLGTISGPGFQLAQVRLKPMASEDQHRGYHRYDLVEIKTQPIVPSWDVFKPQQQD